jgi:hypothetical protein
MHQRFLQLKKSAKPLVNRYLGENILSAGNAGNDVGKTFWLNMQVITLNILNATLRADASITAAERNRILKIARNGESTETEKNGHEPSRIYSRAEAAKLLGDKTTRFVDLLCRRGLLKKFTAPGSQRAIGITSASLESFIGGN